MAAGGLARFGRYYGTKMELVTVGAFPVAAYRVNRWLSIGGGAQIVYGKLNSKTGINDVLDGGTPASTYPARTSAPAVSPASSVEPVEGTRFGVT